MPNSTQIPGGDAAPLGSPLNNPRPDPRISLPAVAGRGRDGGFGVRESVRERGAWGGRAVAPGALCELALSCPHCHRLQAETQDVYARPTYIKCDTCDRLIPTAGWGVADIVLRASNQAAAARITVAVPCANAEAWCHLGAGKSYMLSLGRIA